MSTNQMSTNQILIDETPINIISVSETPNNEITNNETPNNETPDNEITNNKREIIDKKFYNHLGFIILVIIIIIGTILAIGMTSNTNSHKINYLEQPEIFTNISQDLNFSSQSIIQNITYLRFN